METTHKAWLGWHLFHLAMVIIACSCGSLSPASSSGSVATYSGSVPPQYRQSEAPLRRLPMEWPEMGRE